MKNFAFISYNHQDVRWAKWLRRRLEWYRLPAEIHNEFEDTRFIRPVIRDRDELNAGVLNEELRTRLEESKYLIVICSPHSAHSRWVSEEVRTFIELGRLEQIIPFIVEGDEFPETLEQWNREHPDRVLLGISVTDDGQRNRQKAFIRLVSRMLGVQFETLWQRHKRAVRLAAAVLTLLLACLLFIGYWFMIPVRLSVRICDERSTLPGMTGAVLTVDGTDYPLTSFDTTITTQSLPGYYRLHSVPVTVRADRFYQSEEQSLQLTAGCSETDTIHMHRDRSFALFAGLVMDADGNPLPDVTVSIDKHTTQTDATGHFRITLPLSEQSEFKAIELSKPGYETNTRTDECPGTDLKYILRK